MDHEDEGLSIRAVVVLAMLVIAAFGWAFAAAAYAHEMEGWASGMGGRHAFSAFALNAVTHIPQAFEVIGFTFTKRLWLAIVILVLEFLVLLGGLGLKKIEKASSRIPRPPRY